MKFRTEVNIPESKTKIDLNDKIFSIGSCFATEISTKLNEAQLQTLNNPFGTIFNPFSVKNTLEKIHQTKVYKKEDLALYRDEYLSLDHHSSFNSGSVDLTLEKINCAVVQANDFLQRTNWVVITYGSSLVYEFLPKNLLVSNCHKIPQTYFKRRFLSHEEITNNIHQSIQYLSDIGLDDLQILFTVSPVRHARDGMVENQLSKAKLFSAIHDVVAQYAHCHYVPIYEIMMDDLRDYRFYKEDLLHPTPQAVQYIWEKFQGAYFSTDAQGFIAENLKIAKALEHRPSDKTHPKYIALLNHLQVKIAEQQQKVHHPIFQQYFKK